MAATPRSPATASAASPRWSRTSRTARRPKSREVVIDTDAGPKTLTLIAHDELERRTIFRAAHGPRRRPAPARCSIWMARASKAAALDMGNPQCVVLDRRCPTRALHRFGPLLQHIRRFPQAVNVEFATVEVARTRAHPDLGTRRRPDRIVGHRVVRVGGRGRSAYGGAARDVDVIAPGGTQRVEWTRRWACS